MARVSRIKENMGAEFQMTYQNRRYKHLLHVSEDFTVYMQDKGVVHVSKNVTAYSYIKPQIHFVLRLALAALSTKSYSH